MRFPVLSKNKIPEKRNGFESLRFLISNCTMLRLPPSLVCQTCEWEPHMSKPRPSTEILARSRLSDSNAVVSQLCILKRVIRKTAQGLGERGAPNPVPTVSFSLGLFNGPFPSSPRSLFQSEGRCSASDMEIIFHSHANKTHFQKKGCAPSLILKVRVFGTRKWPIFATSLRSEILVQAT